VAYGRRRGVYVVQGEGGGGRNVDEREHEQSVPIQAAPAQGVVPRLTPTPKTTSQVLVTPLQAMLFLITATTSASEFRFRLPIISLSISLALNISEFFDTNIIDLFVKICFFFLFLCRFFYDQTCLNLEILFYVFLFFQTIVAL